ncbi:MAG: putative toxin-antitoxin system toxin component, PIN family [Solirubrobacteraceae bacterium]
MRAVLDPNVIISALLSPTGKPAALLRAWERGQFELIVSGALLEELERALAYPKLRRLIPKADAQAVVKWLSESATVVREPDAQPPVRSADPGDDYLIALAAARQAILVSGDRHLLDLAAEIPVFTPAVFCEQLTQ